MPLLRPGTKPQQNAGAARSYQPKMWDIDTNRAIRRSGYQAWPEDTNLLDKAQYLTDPNYGPATSGAVGDTLWAIANRGDEAAMKKYQDYLQKNQYAGPYPSGKPYADEFYEGLVHLQPEKKQYGGAVKAQQGSKARKLWADIKADFHKQYVPEGMSKEDYGRLNSAIGVGGSIKNVGVNVGKEILNLNKFLQSKHRPSFIKGLGKETSDIITTFDDIDARTPRSYGALFRGAEKSHGMTPGKFDFDKYDNLLKSSQKPKMTPPPSANKRGGVLKAQGGLLLGKKKKSTTEPAPQPIMKNGMVNPEFGKNSPDDVKRRAMGAVPANFAEQMAKKKAKQAKKKQDGGAIQRQSFDTK